MAMGADYAFELIFNETYAPQFNGHNKFFLASVSKSIRKMTGKTHRTPPLLPQLLSQYSKGCWVTNHNSQVFDGYFVYCEFLEK